MTFKKDLPELLAKTTKLEDEISVTGKWIAKKNSMFGRSSEYQKMINTLKTTHINSDKQNGLLSSEINAGVGNDSVLIHNIFKDEESLVNYFSQLSSGHTKTLYEVAKPDMHLVRGVKLSDNIRATLTSNGILGEYGQYLYGFVKDDYQLPDQKNTIQVTAKWSCKDDDAAQFEELKYWWQQVGEKAFTLEEGLLRFEVFEVAGENALIIHETFENTSVLQFHLAKGTAAIYKKDIDKIAVPVNYFFRGPVSWMIRTYSKFLRLPATYSHREFNFIKQGGSMSEGRVN